MEYCETENVLFREGMHARTSMHAWLPLYIMEFLVVCVFVSGNVSGTRTSARSGEKVFERKKEKWNFRIVLIIAFGGPSLVLSSSWWS